MKLLECTLRVKDGQLLLTHKADRLRRDDEVWAFNTIYYNKQDFHLEILTPYYQVGYVVDIWTQIKAGNNQQFLNIKFKNGDYINNVKIESVEKVELQGPVIAQYLTHKECEAINRNNGVCYLDTDSYPRAIYMTPLGDMVNEKGILAKELRKQEILERSDESIHAQYDM